MKKIIMLIGCFFPLISMGDIFDDPENLKILDKNISPGELREVMRGMSVGLGVRCNHCHVGVDGDSLRTFDFPSDDKENKGKARFMMKMVNELNKHIVTGIKDRTVEVKCATCHRGAIKPILTIDLLKQKIQESGVDVAMAHYDELRDKYFGTHTHNFREWTLINLALTFKDSDTDVAKTILDKNLILYPNSFQTMVYLGDVNLKLKNPKKALEFYNNAKNNKDKPQPWLDKKIQSTKKQL